VGLAANMKPWQVTHMTSAADSNPTFSASEAEKLTGVATSMQRDWRRRGFLPSNEAGWTRFTLRDLSRLLLLNMFSKQGIGPTSSIIVVENLEAQLCARVASLIGGRDEPEMNGASVIWADGTLGGPYDSAQQAFDGASPAQQAGPCILIDIPTISTAWGIQVRDSLRTRAA
jgi:hypothetical protein